MVLASNCFAHSCQLLLFFSHRHRTPAVLERRRGSQRFVVCDNLFSSLSLPKSETMSDKKVINFSAGPAKVPEEVLDKVREELLDCRGQGISVMEMSHRSSTFQNIIEEAEKNLRDLMSIPSNYKVLFMHGGGSGQFSAVPLNLCTSADFEVDYMITGTWSSKAAKEAQKYCRVNRVFPKTEKYICIPEPKTWKFSPNAKYIYYCDNETIHGVEYPDIPETGGIPLVCDMSSNILTRPVDVSKFALIYAGAQKNIGIAGVTVVIIREELIGRANPICPVVLDYKIQADNQSLYNTPATFSIYVMALVFQWLKKQGGVKEMANRSNQKCSLVYDLINNSGGFYKSTVKPKYQSRVNLPFRIGEGNEDLEKLFLKEAGEQKMIQLKGHRSVGGIRVSLFNAITLDETRRLVDFMKDFQAKHS